MINAKKKSVGGFTLIEIMIVIVIMAMASSVVFMNIGKNHSKRANKDFLQKVVSQCRRARFRAIQSGEKNVFQILSTDRKCRIEGLGDGFAIPETIEVAQEGVLMIEEGLYGIVFFPDGSSSGGELLFSVSGGDDEWTIRVDRLTGVVSKK